MGSQIDEFLAKKKEQTTLLDLHNCTANSKEELRKLVEKVPEFKIKPEKKPDDIKIREKKFKFKLPKKEIKKPFPFAEPTPSEMKGVSLEELYSINQNIPWKMLTSLRPKSKIDEEYFSRQIELGTATLKTRNAEKRNAPRDGYLRKRKNASGGVEAKFPSCKECGVEFCAGDGCNAFDYDSFKRRVATAAAAAGAGAGAAGTTGQSAAGGGDHAHAGGDKEHGGGAPAKKTVAKKKNATAAGRGGTTTTAAAAAAQRARAAAGHGDDRGGAAKTTGRKGASSRPVAPLRPVCKPKTGDGGQAAARKTVAAAVANDRGPRAAKKPSDRK